MKRVSWQELRDCFKIVGWVENRTKGDHLIMTKPGTARPIVIKMDKDLGEDIVRTNLRTAGISRDEFLKLMNTVRRRRK